MSTKLVQDKTEVLRHLQTALHEGGAHFPSKCSCFEGMVFQYESYEPLGTLNGSDANKLHRTWLFQPCSKKIHSCRMPGSRITVTLLKQTPSNEEKYVRAAAFESNADLLCISYSSMSRNRRLDAWISNTFHTSNGLSQIRSKVTYIFWRFLDEYFLKIKILF